MRTELLIEDEDACTLAAELVELTGESLRLAVVTALREQIARETARRARQERIMAITRDIALGSAPGRLGPPIAPTAIAS